MAKRKFIIDIYKRDDWYIRPDGVQSYSKFDTLDINAFGIARKTSDGKIAYLFDIFPRDEDIELVKTNKLFNEVVSFECYINDKESTSFEGTFVQALEHIKKEFTDE